MTKRFDITSSFYRIPTPSNAPLRSGLGDFYRFKTTPFCAKCDKPFPHPLFFQSPKYEISPRNIQVLVSMPSVHDEEVMEFFIVKAVNEGVGCWTECRCGKNWNMKCLNNCVKRGLADASGGAPGSPGFRPARPGDCGCLCTCNPGCGNRRIYPCRCGKIELYHAKGCPVGLFKREQSFLIPWQRKMMLRAGQKRERLLRA